MTFHINKGAGDSQFKRLFSSRFFLFLYYTSYNGRSCHVNIYRIDEILIIPCFSGGSNAAKVGGRRIEERDLLRDFLPITSWRGNRCERGRRKDTFQRRLWYTYLTRQGEKRKKSPYLWWGHITSHISISQFSVDRGYPVGAMSPFKRQHMYYGLGKCLKKSWFCSKC